MKENMILHNRFDVTVMDATTGEVKQKAVGYNVITNQFFTYRLGDQKRVIADYRLKDLFNCIGVGTGQGVPAVTDTSLFDFLKRKLSTTVQEHYAYPTSYRTTQIKLEANECIGEHITEVGIFYNTHSSYLDRDSYNIIMTHAMLQDSEGNPIAIDKTDTDVVLVNATFFCTVSLTGFGSHAVFPTPEQNYLVRWVLFGTMYSEICMGRFPISSAEQMMVNGKPDCCKRTGAKAFALKDGTEDMENLRLDFPLVTFLDGECNDRVVRYFGNPGIGVFSFPDHEVFPPYQVDHLVVGEGDGTTQDFNVKCPLIQRGTARVFVGGEELPSSEYEVDYESNCGDWYENYASASLCTQDANVAFGTLNPVGSSGYTYRDPLLWSPYYESSKYPSYCYIAQDTPVLLDFGEAVECNTLKIEESVNALNSTYIDKAVIQFSDDGESWTDVEYTRMGQVWRWDLVSARYWRFYIDGYRWYYYLTRNTISRDGQNFGCTFFLGKTVPGLHLKTPPQAGQTVEMSYAVDVPFKTANNIIRFTCSVQLQRGV